MKKKMLYLLILLFFMVVPFSNKVFAEETLNYNGYEYYIDSNNEVVITKYTANESEVIIPSEINGYPVTTISKSAFNKHIGAQTSNIETIVVPSSIKYIRTNAFRLIDNATIYINSYDVEYEYTDYGNIVFSVSSTNDYKLYVVSRSGSTTEEYFNNYYVAEYYTSNGGEYMKWNELCGQVYYTNEDWVAPDSISFENTNDISVTVSTDDEKQYVTFPKTSFYNGNTLMNGDLSNPFDDYDNVKLMYSTSLNGEKKDLDFSVVDKGVFKTEFTTAGTYYVYPVYCRKAGSTYLASNYMTSAFLYGNPIKVTVNKKLFVPDNNNITVTYKLSSVTKYEVKNGDTVQLDLPSYKKSNEKNIYISVDYKAPKYNKNNYYFDNNSLITFTTSNDVASATSSLYEPITFGVTSSKNISINKNGQTKITLTNGYGLNFSFNVNINFLYAKSANTKYTQTNPIYLENGKTYKISDLVEFEWGGNYTDSQKAEIIHANLNGIEENLPFTINSDGTITFNNLASNSSGSIGLFAPSSTYGSSVGVGVNYTTSVNDYTKEPFFSTTDFIFKTVYVGETLDISLDTDKIYNVEYTILSEIPKEQGKQVATVDTNGVVKGLNSGNINIKAKAPSSYGYRIYYVTVDNKSTGGNTPVIDEPVIDKPSINYYETKTEKSITLYANTNLSSYDIKFADASIYGGFGYYISSNDGSVKLDGTNIIALKAGNCIVEAKPYNGSGYIRYYVTVKKGSVDLNCSNTVSVLAKKSFTGQVVSYGVDNDTIANVSSSNKKIVTVSKSGSNGFKISGKKKGSAKITIETKAGVKKTITVKVSNSLKPSISINKSSISLKKSKTFKLEPVIKAVTKNGKITYSSTNKKIATVNSKGVITGKKKGSCKIQVKMDGKVVKTVKVKVK